MKKKNEEESTAVAVAEPEPTPEVESVSSDSLPAKTKEDRIISVDVEQFEQACKILRSATSPSMIGIHEYHVDNEPTGKLMVTARSQGDNLALGVLLDTVGEPTGEFPSAEFATVELKYMKSAPKTGTISFRFSPKGISLEWPGTSIALSTAANMTCGFCFPKMDGPIESEKNFSQEFSYRDAVQIHDSICDAIGTDSHRPVLTVSLVERESFIATDTYRLNVVRRIKHDAKVPIGFFAITAGAQKNKVPVKKLELDHYSDGTVIGRLVLLNFPTVYGSSTILGAYPQYERAIPPTDTYCELNKLELQNAVEKLMPFAGANKITFDFSKKSDAVLLSATNDETHSSQWVSIGFRSDRGRFESGVPSMNQVAINGTFVLDGLKAMGETDTVQLHSVAGNHSRPWLMKPTTPPAGTNCHQFVVLMPMSLN